MYIQCFQFSLNSRKFLEFHNKLFNTGFIQCPQGPAYQGVCPLVSAHRIPCPLVACQGCLSALNASADECCCQRIRLLRQHEINQRHDNAFHAHVLISVEANLLLWFGMVYTISAFLSVLGDFDQSSAFRAFS